MDRYVDFSSALYLGLKYPWAHLRPWNQLTFGKPYALFEPYLGVTLANKLARLQGFKNGTLGTSTLHFFYDIFNIWKGRCAIFYDSSCYSILKWAAKRARISGSKVFPFSHHSPEKLANLLKDNHKGGVVPIILTDSYCISCGKLSPLIEYARLAKKFNGYLIIDDTQVIGIFGEKNKNIPFYGTCGGGSIKWLGMSEYTDNLISITSLSKGFGIPVAIMSAPTYIIDSYKGISESRIHTSPPNNCILACVQKALEINKNMGDTLRIKLLNNVLYFKEILNHLNIHTNNNCYPVQTISFKSTKCLVDTFNALRKNGILTVPLKNHGYHSGSLAFCISSAHQKKDFEDLGDVLARIKTAHDNHLNTKKNKVFY